MIRSAISGVGSALPRRVVPNAELEGKLETADAWMRERTGLCKR